PVLSKKPRLFVLRGDGLLPLHLFATPSLLRYCQDASSPILYNILQQNVRVCAKLLCEKERGLLSGSARASFAFYRPRQPHDPRDALPAVKYSARKLTAASSGGSPRAEWVR